MTAIRRALFAAVLALLLPFLGAPSAHAGGNYLYVLTKANWWDIHEGELGSSVATSCNDCYWSWEPFYVTSHGNEYHERVYNNSAGGWSLVFFRDSPDGKRVGYKTWWCGSSRQAVPACDGDVQDFTG